MKKQRGITLIALVITIIVLLILAGVSISLTLGQNGVLTQAKNAVEKHSDAEVMEQIALACSNYQIQKALGTTKTAKEIIESDLKKTLNDSNLTVKVSESGEEIYVTTVVRGTSETYKYNFGTGKSEKLGQGGEQLNVTPISKVETENFIGYYADINKDGKVDGVIFADQLVGNTKGGQWADIEGTYTIPKLNASELKDYYVSKEKYTWAGIEKPVLSPTGEGKGRFYVMALSDIDTNGHYWYKNAVGNMNDYETATSEDFGKGKKNTEDMIARWNKGAVSNGGYGEKDNNDMWGLIETQVEEGWFVPSRAEWSAFAQELEIDNGNYRSGICDAYWTSSQDSNYDAFDIYFPECMYSVDVDHSIPVRLATTF